MDVAESSIASGAEAMYMRFIVLIDLMVSVSVVSYTLSFVRKHGDLNVRPHL